MAAAGYQRQGWEKTLICQSGTERQSHIQGSTCLQMEPLVWAVIVYYVPSINPFNRYYILYEVCSGPGPCRLVLYYPTKSTNQANMHEFFNIQLNLLGPPAAAHAVLLHEDFRGFLSSLSNSKAMPWSTVSKAMLRSSNPKTEAKSVFRRLWIKTF